MANTYSSAVDSIFARSLLALRKNVTLPRLIRTDWSPEVAQAGSTITIPLPPTLTVSDVSPSNTPLAQVNHTRNVTSIALSNWRKTSMTLTDKEVHELADGARDGDISSAMGVIAEDVNEKILAKFAEVYGYAGVAGTTPFANDLSEAVEANKILTLQKCPKGDRSIVLGATAESNALLLRSIQDASMRGGAGALLNGEIGNVLGFKWMADQQVPLSTLVGDDCLLDDSAARAADSTTLHVDGLTTAPAAGDVFTIAGQYQNGVDGDLQTFVIVSATALAGTDSDLTFTPGTTVAIAAADGNEAVTFKATHRVNLAFHRDAFALAVRPLAPADGFTGGNLIRTEMDPVTGIGITLEVMRQLNQTLFQWSILYGVKCIRPEYACRIAG